jgi:hypothetical protein
MAKIIINDPSFTPTPIAAPAPPTQPAPAVAAPSKTTATAMDSRGRNITVRRLLPLHKLRLFAVAGELASNEAWMSLAAIAWAVTSIDSDPVTVNSRREIEYVLERLSDEGLEAAALAYISIMPPGETAEEAQNTARF